MYMAWSKYRCISWHKGLDKWAVQLRWRRRKIYKVFTQEDDAIAYLTLTTQRPAQYFVRSVQRPPRMHFPQYRGVAWHKGAQKFIAQARGQTLGTFTSQLRAAQAASSFLGVSVKSLHKRVKMPAAYTLQRMKLLCPVFQHSLPGDLASATAHEVSSARMFRAEPALRTISLLGKYGPFKDALRTSWEESRCQGVPQGRASIILAVMQMACRKYCKLPQQELETWITHCGLNVSHHSGPLPLCRCAFMQWQCKGGGWKHP